MNRRLWRCVRGRAQLRRAVSMRRTTRLRALPPGAGLDGPRAPLDPLLPVGVVANDPWLLAGVQHHVIECPWETRCEMIQPWQQFVPRRRIRQLLFTVSTARLLLLVSPLVMEVCQEDTPMTRDEVRAAAKRVTQWHGRFAGLFGRKEPQGHSLVYLKGLISDQKRKSVEPIALQFARAPDGAAALGDGHRHAVPRGRILPRRQDAPGDVISTVDRTSLIFIDPSSPNSLSHTKSRLYQRYWGLIVTC